MFKPKGRWPLSRIALAIFLCVVNLGGAGPMSYYRLIADKAVVDGAVHEGVEAQVDLPASQHVKNFGWPYPNGPGCCVFTSITMDARWHNIPTLINLAAWDKDGKPHTKISEGGGYPSKVADVLERFAPGVPYVQDETDNPSPLDKALAEGRPACVTYGYGERYNMDTIAHMVLLVHLDAKWAAILDNNFPGTLEWMPRDEFLRRWKHPNDKGWYIIFLGPLPPPVPHN